MDLYLVLKRPVTTEKTTILSSGLRQYTFEVDKRANKHLVKDAVEKIFDVNVVKVNVMTVPPRPRRWGKIQGHRPSWKKAIITLADGDTISFFEGV